jgi:hypothetical protein
LASQESAFCPPRGNWPENKLADRPLASFAEKVIRVLQTKYDQREGRMFGKKLL